MTSTQGTAPVNRVIAKIGVRRASKLKARGAIRNQELTSFACNDERKRQKREARRMARTRLKLSDSIVSANQGDAGAC